jgi:uncharacterized protein YecE (DUF72 family)
MVYSMAKDLPAKLRIGCSGWGYDDWLGGFYPEGTPKSDYLKLYSSTFDTVEVDSSYYRIPQPVMTANWRRTVPDGFLFTAKFPKKITHEKKLVHVEDPLSWMYRSMAELKDRLGALVVQLPPSVKYTTHLAAMQEFLGLLDPKVRHAIEFRHKSWFRDDVYAMLRDKNVAMAWTENQYVTSPPVVTADFVYMRLVGERDIKEFKETVKDRSKEMREWYAHLEEKAGDAKQVFVFFNNHYAGFGPASANEFRRLAGLMEVGFPAAGGGRQRGLEDFR